MRQQIENSAGQQNCKSAGQIPTIIATCSTDSDRKSLYENAGCEVIITKESEQHVDLKELMNILGEKVSTA